MMKSRFIKSSVNLLLLSVLLVGCFESEYSKHVKKELAKGVREDSLIFGLKFGDSRDRFFGRCFDLNRQQLVSQGPNGNSVQHYFKDSAFHDRPYEIRMLFSPHFDQTDGISEMQIELSYSEWAPWNTKCHADSLKPKVLKLIEKWYGGNKFITAHIGDQDVPVKVDGNRRILVNIKDAQSVKVRMQDLLNPEFQHSITKQEVSEDKGEK